MVDAESSQEGPYWQIDDDHTDLPCKICEEIDYSGDMWQCLACFEAFHPSCVLPKGEEVVDSNDDRWCEWFCSECISSRRYRLKYRRRPKVSIKQRVVRPRRTARASVRHSPLFKLHRILRGVSF